MEVGTSAWESTKDSRAVPLYEEMVSCALACHVLATSQTHPPNKPQNKHPFKYSPSTHRTRPQAQASPIPLGERSLRFNASSIIHRIGFVGCSKLLKLDGGNLCMTMEVAELDRAILDIVWKERIEKHCAR